MAVLKVNLFGEFRIWHGEDLIESRKWGRQKTRLLLKLLLTRPGCVFSRDEILEALWPGVPLESAEHSLRMTVSLLRRVLEPDLKRGTDSRYILRKRPGYLFNQQAGCRVDAWEFNELKDKAEAAQQQGKLEQAIAGYREALKLIQGEFLAEDPYEDWAMEAREEWRERQLSVLSNLAECLALHGLYTEAIEVCERAVSLDEYREDLHRRLMLYHYAAGEQALALQAYRRYARRLKEVLGAAPSPELVRLREHIEARDVPGVDEGRRRYPRPRRPLRFPYSLSRTPFVGRDREYALLVGRLKETLERSGGTIVVEGEAGVGKTRLVEEFLGYARSRGVRVFAGRCYERELGPPLEPIVDAVGSLVEHKKVSRMFDEGFGYEQQVGTAGGARIYGALLGSLIQLSQNRGVVALFVDDLQWADAATLEFLAYAARRVAGEKILLVLTYRREEVARLSGWLESLAERRAINILSLGRLSLEDTTELLRRMSYRGFGGLSTLAGFLQQESEGNPFYAVEYLRWLIETGVVNVDARRRMCALKSEALQRNALPSGVRSLLQARLNGLSEEAQDLLKLAAIIGRSFDLGLLCKVDARGEVESLGVIEPLMVSGLIVEATEEATYHFSHDKLRQTLYEGIGEPRRRALHLRVAKVLEGDGGEPAELAHHYLRAKAWSPALENLVRAARKAEESYAWDTALKNYTRALEVAKKLPDSEQTRFELLAAQESLLERRMAGRTERAAAVQEMLELANLLGDRARLAEVHLRRIGVLAAFSDLEGATEAGRVAVEIFRELGDEAGEAQAHHKVGYASWVNRDYAGALKANFQALRLHRTIGDQRAAASDFASMAQIYRNMGNYKQALRWAEEAARTYQELGNKVGEAWAMSIMAGVHRDRGDPEAALPLALKTLQFFTKLGNRHSKFGMVSLQNACGTLYLDLGAPEKALEHFRAAIHLSRERGQIANEMNALLSIGVSLEQVGNLAGAADAYRRAIELMETDYELSGTPEQLSVKADALTLLAGVLHHSLDEPVEALKAYEAATEIYRELGDAHRLQKPLLGLAGLRWRMGNLIGSTRGYEEALNLAQEHGETAHEAAALASLSVVYRDLGRLREALRRGRAALWLLRELGDLQAEAYVLSSLAESHGKLGHYPSALSCLRRSLRLRRKLGDKEGEVGVLYDLARIYEDVGDTDRGRACSEEAALKKETLEQAQLALGEERSN